MKECFKIPYPNQHVAEESLRRLKSKKSIHKKGRTYQCPICGKWHVTKLSIKDRK